MMMTIKPALPVSVFVVFLVTVICISWQLRLCHTLVPYLFMAAFSSKAHGKQSMVK